MVQVSKNEVWLAFNEATFVDVRKNEPKILTLAIAKYYYYYYLRTLLLP